jgi:Protein of unknown function (DUF3703)
MSDHHALQQAWAAERAAARTARASRDAVAEWHHLERAHVLSQPLAAALTVLPIPDDLSALLRGAS